jgi:hypothetical protein
MTGPAGPTYGGGIASAVSPAAAQPGAGLSAGPAYASSGPVGGGYSGYSQSSAPQGGPVGGGFQGNAMGSMGQFGGGPIGGGMYGGGTPGYGGPGQGGGYASGYGGLGAPQGPGIGAAIGGGFGPPSANVQTSPAFSPGAGLSSGSPMYGATGLGLASQAAPAPAVTTGAWDDPNALTVSREALQWSQPGAVPPGYGLMGWSKATPTNPGGMIASPEARAAALRAMGVDPAMATPGQLTTAAESLYAKDPSVLGGIPFGTLNQLINVENRNWDPNLPNQPAPGKKPTSALGLTQVLSGTAGDIGITDRYSPEQQIFGGAAYLAGGMPNAPADLASRLAQYGEGPGYASKVARASAAAPTAFNTAAGYQSPAGLTAVTGENWSGPNFEAASPGIDRWGRQPGLSSEAYQGTPISTNIAPTSSVPIGQPVRDPVTGQPIDPMTGRPVPGVPVPGVNTDAYGRPVTPQTISPGRAMLSDIARTTTPTSVPGLLSGEAIQPTQVAPTPGQPVAPTPGQQVPEGLLGPVPEEQDPAAAARRGLAAATGLPPAQTVPSQDLPYGIGVGIDPTVPTTAPPETQISDFYRSALESMLQPKPTPVPAVSPAEQRLQDIQTYGVFSDPAAAARRGLLPGTTVPEQVSAPEVIAPNTLPPGYPPTAPSIPAARMAPDLSAAARRGLLPGAPAPATGVERITQQFREAQPAPRTPGAPQQLTQPPARAPISRAPVAPGSAMGLPAPAPVQMQTGLPPGLLGPLGAGGGQGGLPIFPAQMAAGAGISRGGGAAQKERGGGPSKGGRARMPSADANIQTDQTLPLREGPSTGKGAGTKDKPGQDKFIQGLLQGATPLGNGYYRLTNGMIWKIQGQPRIGAAGGGPDEGGGKGGGKGSGKEPFLTLGGSSKGQGKNPFITLMGDPNAKAWKNRNPILNFNSPRIAAIRSGKRKPNLAEVAAAALPLGLIS